MKTFAKLFSSHILIRQLEIGKGLKV